MLNIQLNLPACPFSHCISTELSHQILHPNQRSGSACEMQKLQLQKRRSMLTHCVSVGAPRHLCAFEVFGGTGVNLDLVAGVDEERNTDSRAGFNSSHLGCTGSSIAAYAGFTVDNFQFNEHWMF